MAERIISWKGIADFSRIRREANETERSLSQLEKQTKANDATDASSTAATVKNEDRVRAARQKVIAQHAQYQQAERASTAANQDAAVQLGKLNAAYDENTRKLRDGTKEHKLSADASKKLSAEKANLERATRSATQALTAESKAQTDYSRAAGRSAAAERSVRQATEEVAAAMQRTSAAVREHGATSAAARDSVTQLRSAQERLVGASRDAETAALRSARASDSLDSSHSRVVSSTNRVRSATQDLRRAHEDAASGAGLFARMLGSLGSAFGGSAGSARGFGAAIGFIKWPIIIFGAQQLLSVISALGAGLISLASAVGPAFGALAAIPTLVGAAAGALGTIKLGFSGIGGVLKAYTSGQDAASKAQLKTASTGAKAADQQIAQAQAIAAAQHGLAQAREQQGLAAQQSADQIHSAEESLANAQYAAVQAQEALTQARIDAKRAIEDLKQSVTDLALSERRASLNVEEAQLRLRKVLANPASTDLEKREAQLAVDEAKNSLKKTQEESKRTQVEYKKAAKAGVEGSKQVKDAKHQEQQANQAVADSQHALAEAQQSAAKSQRDAAYAVTQAVQQLADAQRKQAEASTAAGAAGGDAMDAYKAKLAALSPAQQAFVKQLISMQGELKTIKATASANMLPGVTQGLKDANVLFPTFNAGVATMGRAIGDVAKQGGKLAATASFQQRLGRLFQASAPLVRIFGDALLHVINGFLTLAVAAAPFTTWIAGVLGSWATYLDQLITVNTENGKFQNYLETVVKPTLKTLGGIIMNVALTLYNVGRAARASGDRMLGSIEDVTAKWKTFTGSVEGQNKLKKYFDDAEGTVRSLTHLIGDLIGIVAGLATSKSAGPLFEQIRTELVPALQNLLAAFQGATGQAVIDFLTNMINTVAKLSGDSTGVVQLFTEVMAGLSGVLLGITQIPGAVPVLGVLVTFFAAMKAANLVATVTGLKGAAGAIRDITRAATGKEARKGASGLATGVGTAIRGARGQEVEGFAGKVGSGARSAASSVASFSASVVKSLGRAALAVGQFLAKWIVAMAQVAARAVVAVAATVAQFAVMIARWTWAATQSLIQAARMAVAWVIALGPIAWIIAGAILLIAGLVFLVTKYWDQISSVTTKVWNAIWGFFQDLFGKIWNFLKTWGPLILVALAPFLGIPLLIWQNWDKIWGFLKAVWDKVWNFLKTWGPLALAVVAPFIGLPLLIYQHWNQLIGWLKTAWNAIKAAFSAAVNWIANLGRTVWNTITAIFEWPVRRFWVGVQRWWNAIKTAFSAAVNWVINFGRTVWNTITGIFEKPVRLLVDVVKNIWRDIKQAFSNAKNGIVNVVKDIAKGVGTAWDAIKEGFKRPVKFVVDTVINKGIIHSINKVTGFFKIPKIPDVPLPFSQGGTAPKTTSFAHHDFARGDWVPSGLTRKVPGAGDRDSVPAMLTPGEFVIRKSAARAIGEGTLRMLNRADGANIGGARRRPLFRNEGGDVPRQHLYWGSGVVGKVVKAGGAAWDATGGKVVHMAAEIARRGAEGLLRLLFVPVRAGMERGLKPFGGSGQFLTKAGNSVMDMALAFVRGIDNKKKAAEAAAGAITDYGPTTGTQLQNATRIVNAGVAMGASDRDNIIALMVALVESNIRNLANPAVPESMSLPHDGVGYDHDSVGAFQQRNSWGSAAQRLNPYSAASLFFNRELAIGNRGSMPMGVVAQTVQVSAFPDRYAARQGQATDIFNRVKNTAPRPIPAKRAGAQQLAGGGYAGGVGDRDTVAAALTPGEFVIRRAAARKLGRKRLEMLNNVDGEKIYFHAGGPVPGLSTKDHNRAIRAMKFQKSIYNTLPNGNAAWTAQLTALLRRGTANPRPFAPAGHVREFVLFLNRRNPPSYNTSAVWSRHSYNYPLAAWLQHKVYMLQRLGKKNRARTWMPRSEQGNFNDVRELRARMHLSHTGRWAADMNAPLDHVIAHALKLPHAWNAPHPWSGPVTAVEQSIQAQNVANALQARWNAARTTIASWGLTDLLAYLEDKGIEEGLPIAESAAKSRANATVLNKSIHDGNLLAGNPVIGGVTFDSATLLKAISVIAGGTAANPIGLRGLATALQVADFSIVNMYDALRKLAKGKVPDTLFARLAKEVGLFRQGLFYAAGGGRAPGSGRGDTVPAMLTPGEFVVREPAARAIGYENLARLNNWDSAAHYAVGGQVGAIVPTARAAVRTAVTAAAGQCANVTFDVDIHNPIIEDAGYSLAKMLQTKAATGQFNRLPQSVREGLRK